MEAGRTGENTWSIIAVRRWTHQQSINQGVVDLTLDLTLQWRHNERDGVSNHQLHDCLFKRLFRRRSKKTSKLRVTGLCEGNSSVTGDFPAQRASNAENVSIWWRHHDMMTSWYDKLSILLALCARIYQWMHKGPVMRSFDISCYGILNNIFNNRLSLWW